MVSVAIAIGSNLGDRRAHLDAAVRRLTGILSGPICSSYHNTAPVGVQAQPDFLNAAVVGDASMSARDLLAALLAIEDEAGRHRPFGGAPRTLDLDLILDGDTVLDQPGLSVPHPRFRERGFVLQPLDEIAPAMVDPVTGKQIRELLAEWLARTG